MDPNDNPLHEETAGTGDMPTAEATGGIAPPPKDPVIQPPPPPDKPLPEEEAPQEAV